MIDGIDGATGPTGAVGNIGATGPQGDTGPLVSGNLGETLVYGNNGWESSNTIYKDNQGNISIGNGTTGSLGYKLYINGTIKTTGITEFSDIRLKYDIKKLLNVLALVKKLEGVTYKWKKDQLSKTEHDIEIGLIAQEVEKIIPEVVDTDENGYKSIQYSHLVPILIEAIKELDNKVEELNNQLDKQSEVDAELKDMINQLYKKVGTHYETDK